MLLLEPDRTPYDLRWRMFGINVRVHPMFWLIAALLGWWAFAVYGHIAYVGLWVVCLFVSILLHELGHVVAGRFFGTRGDIILYGFGGLAVGASDLPYRWQRVIVYLAGPGAQFLLWGVLYFTYPHILRPFLFTDFAMPVAAALGMLWLINLFWPIFNLLPIWPLDGGQVSRELCEAASPPSGRRYSLIISLVVAAVLAVHVLLSLRGPGLFPWLNAWLPMGPIMALFFAMFALQSFLLLQEESRSRSNWEDDRLPWER